MVVKVLQVRKKGYVKTNVNIHMMRLASRYGVPNSVPSEADTDTLV